jgi:hypothetical protein
MHNFTKLAIELNEPEDGVPPTDSRNRPDQRTMEEGNWSQANLLKQKLEEAQRKRRKEREDNDIGWFIHSSLKSYLLLLAVYSPRWFRTKNSNDMIDDNDIYEFDERYLECRASNDWTVCPGIFELEQ